VTKFVLRTFDSPGIGLANPSYGFGDEVKDKWLNSVLNYVLNGSSDPYVNTIFILLDYFPYSYNLQETNSHLARQPLSQWLVTRQASVDPATTLPFSTIRLILHPQQSSPISKALFSHPTILLLSRRLLCRHFHKPCSQLSVKGGSHMGSNRGSMWFHTLQHEKLWISYMIPSSPMSRNTI
jgi:hypothetical protein